MNEHEIEMIRAALIRAETACLKSVTITAADLRLLLDEIETIRAALSESREGHDHGAHAAASSFQE